jgi:hypothetical protein
LGNFSEHILQAKNNLVFLSEINKNINNRWDWQVTTCFYSAVHLINAHLVNKTGKNYLSHNQVAEHINPYNNLSVSKLDEETYLSYNKLHQLSRRSRYLLNENFKKKGVVDVQPACITYDKHLKKAIRHLDNVINYISKEYGAEFNPTQIKCIELNGLQFNNFKIL